VRAILVLLALAVTAAYAVVAQLPEGSAQADSWLETRKASRPQELQSIALDGRDLPTAQLREVLSSHVGEQLDYGKLDADRVALREALAARGYLAADVDAPVVTFGTGGGAFVTFAVHPGALYHLRDVTVTGPAARAAGVVTIGAGEVAEADRIARARQGVANVLATRGKTSGAVEAKLHVDAAAAAVDVELATR
jgi:outer membrane protein assembly factor BamA